MTTSVSGTREIAAPPDAVWALVSDLPRMGEWSNENVGGRWIGASTGPIPGARFRGANRNGFRRWKTGVTVVESEPGSAFRFRVDLFGLPISEWSYALEPTEVGCRVTESWQDRRPSFFLPFARLATGVDDREQHTRAGIDHTLERLAAAAEGATA